MLPKGSSASFNSPPSSHKPKLKMLFSTINTEQFHLSAGRLTGGMAVNSAGRIYFGNGSNIGSIEPDGSVFPRQLPCQRRASIDGPADSACFTDVGLMCSDSEDNLYIADAGLIRKVDPDFTVTTVADMHQDLGYDFRPLVEVTGIASDAFRNVYFGAVVFIYDGGADKYKVYERSIIRMNPDGVVSEVLDLPQLDNLGAIRLDATQNLYLISSTRIFRRSPDGHMSVFAELGGNSSPSDIVIDSAGAAYVSDLAQHCVHRISPDGEVSTVLELNSPGAMALLGFGKLAVAARGGIYVQDIDMF